MKTVIEFNDLAFPIKVEQAEDGNARFRVTYGQQQRRTLTYLEAAREVGHCLFHALACDGRLSNGGE